MSKKVAVVTGSNKGVGFAIVRSLCKKFEGDVFLTSRDEGRGKEAVDELEKEGLHPRYHQLDLNSRDSVVKLRDYLQKEYNGLDLLVNNAGIAYKMDSKAPFGEQASVTVQTNFTDTLSLCEVLFPLLRPHARVVNVSSLMSQISLAKCSEKLRARFTDPDITLDELKSLIKTFVDAAQNNRHQEEGFSNSSYGMSKIGVTVLSIIQQRELDQQGKDDIVVNACCPGYVSTDMTSHKGLLTIDQGAETPVHLALLPANVKSPRGQFIREKAVADWKA